MVQFYGSAHACATTTTRCVDHTSPALITQMHCRSATHLLYATRSLLRHGADVLHLLLMLLDAATPAAGGSSLPLIPLIPDLPVLIIHGTVVPALATVATTASFSLHLTSSALFLFAVPHHSFLVVILVSSSVGVRTLRRRGGAVDHCDSPRTACACTCTGCCVSDPTPQLAMRWRSRG